MRRLTSIVAVNHDGVIGAKNELPWRVKSDLRFFRQQTLEQVVIMGRVTHDSLGGCLPRRTNIVVTHGFGLGPVTATCRYATGIPEALATAEKVLAKKQDAFVIGGATMYTQLAPYVDRYLVTLIDKKVEGGDTFFDYRSFASENEWETIELFRGEANDEGDEADFVVWEVVSRTPEVFAERRQKAIDEHLARSPKAQRRKHIEKIEGLRAAFSA